MMTDAERQEWDLKMRTLDAEIAHLNAETAKALREMRFPPVVIAAIVLGLLSPVLTALILAN
jgi:hypothetical protein